MFSKRNSIQSRFLNKMLIITFASIALWSFIRLTQDWIHFKSESSALRTQHIEDQKETIKREVELVVQYIQRMDKDSEEKLINSLKDRVNEAHAIASGIYKNNSDQLTNSQIKGLIKDALRPIRFFEGRGYYFAVSMDGIEQLYPVKPEYEGQNVLGLQDSKGNYVIRDEIEVIKKSGEGFVKHFWSKPTAPQSQAHLKISYIKYFEPLDWYIGSGEYLDESLKMIQAHVLDHLANLRFGKEGYFFGSTFTSNPLFSNGKITAGSDTILDLTDPNGVKIIQEQQDIVKGRGKGFVRYSWQKLDQDKPSPKISFVKGYPKWQWIIGAGVYLDTIEQSIFENRTTLLDRLKREVAIDLFVLLVLLMIVFSWYKRTANQINISLDSFSNFLNRAKTESITIDIDTLQLDEFKKIANSINQMLNDRIEDQKSLQKSEERFKLAMDAAKDGLWDWNIQTDEVYYSPGYVAMLGYDSTQIPPHVDSWKDLIHPNDSDQAFKANLGCIEGHCDHFKIEFRMQAKNGDWRWILRQGKAVERDENRRAVRMVGTHTDITERKESEERFKVLHNASFGGIAIHDKGIILECNKGMSDVSGYKYDELIGMNGLLLISDDTRDLVLSNINSGYEKPYEATGVRKSGETYPLRIEARNIPYKGKTVRTVEFRDLTDQKKAEAEKEELQIQLTQAQKMESIGRLAGGVAHDFNNMLSIILGNLELVLDDIEESNPLTHNLNEVQKAAQRSTHLTRQLLAFARKQTVSPKVLDLNDAIEGMLKMLSRLIGEDIELSWYPKESLWPVKIDPSQVDQILANLCVNARDSIKDVGKVIIETDHVQFDQAYCRDHKGFIEGEFVSIGISDNGSGMDKDTLDNLFEPFFTTKEFGEGTGLGLATVYGIVKQNNGFVNVYSEPGQGTTFKVYLPRQAQNPENDHKASLSNTFLKGDETILLVEDEKSILRMTKMMLERLGYTVISASTPDQAISISKSFNKEIKLLMTDVVMPSMNGRDLASEVFQIFPSIKCLYMSGYTANVIAHRGVLDEGLYFINKPFSKHDLSLKLREILDE